MATHRSEEPDVKGSDAHYNEPGGVPPALEDHKPTDMFAARGIFLVIIITGFLFLALMAAFYYF